MDRFDADELRRFLRAVDEHLDGEAHLRVIGGGAAALGYGVPVTTSDIDTFESQPGVERIGPALARAAEVTGLHVPVREAAVADAPLNYEDRLRPVLTELGHLRVSVLDPHDLALSKMVRGEENDYFTVGALHRLHPLDFDILVERFISEMSAAIGHPRTLCSKFLCGIDRLFGELKRVETERRLAGPKATPRR
jgi:hypothetical protein